MSKVKIELESDQIDAIIVQDLRFQLNSLKQSLEMEDPRVFYLDPEKDRAKIKKHVEAFKKVLSWYGDKDA